MSGHAICPLCEEQPEALHARIAELEVERDEHSAERTRLVMLRAVDAEKIRRLEVKLKEFRRMAYLANALTTRPMYPDESMRDREEAERGLVRRLAKLFSCEVEP